MIETVGEVRGRDSRKGNGRSNRRALRPFWLESAEQLCCEAREKARGERRRGRKSEREKREREREGEREREREREGRRKRER